jgi:hypothetical protein
LFASITCADTLPIDEAEVESLQASEVKAHNSAGIAKIRRLETLMKHLR